MALAHSLPRTNRATSPTLVVTPVMGTAGRTVRVECTGCTAVLVITGFAMVKVHRLVVAAEKLGHSCSENS